MPYKPLTIIFPLHSTMRGRTDMPNFRCSQARLLRLIRTNNYRLRVITLLGLRPQNDVPLVHGTSLTAKRCTFSALDCTRARGGRGGGVTLSCFACRSRWNIDNASHARGVKVSDAFFGGGGREGCTVVSASGVRVKNRLLCDVESRLRQHSCGTAIRKNDAKMIVCLQCEPPRAHEYLWQDDHDSVTWCLLHTRYTLKK